MRGILAALMVVGLAGCGPQMGWKGSATAAQYDRDHATCRAQAAERLPPTFRPGPQAVAVAVVNPRPSPFINSIPGANEPQDLNRNARRDSYDACMMDRGYQWGQITR